MKMLFVGCDDGTVQSSVTLNGRESLLILGSRTLEGRHRALEVEASSGYETLIEIRAELSPAEIQYDKEIEAKIHRKSSETEKEMRHENVGEQKI